MSGLRWARTRRSAVLALITMAPTHVAAAFASPQEDPFLLLESTLKAVECILRHAAQQPLQRCWSNGRTLHYCALPHSAESFAVHR